MLPLMRLCTHVCTEPETPAAPTVDPFARQWNTFSMSADEKEAYTKKEAAHTAQTATLRQFQQKWDPARRTKERNDAFFGTCLRPLAKFLAACVCLHSRWSWRGLPYTN
jgi:hypothetical protein